MKIAYFTPSPVKVSETFFSFLIKGLESKAGAGSFMHVVGSKSGKRLVENTFFSNFVHNNQLLRVLYALQERLQHKRNWSMLVMQWYARKKLAPIESSFKPDVAHIEYGKTAVCVYKFLESRNIPFIVHFHGKDASADFNSRTYEQEIKKVFIKASYIITASHHIRRLLILRGCPSDKVRVIRLGIDLDKMQPLSWETRRLSPPSIVFLGRLEEKKHPIALLYAFKLVKEKISEAKLTIIGDGSLYDQVKTRIKELGLSGAVEMTGAMKHEKAIEVMNRHWLFAQHNVSAVNGDQEGYVLATAEAAALELPVVTTLHNGIPEHVLDGETGYLVQEYDYEAMALKMVELLENFELSQSFGRRGRSNILRINNPQARIDSIYSLLNSASQH